MTCENLAGCPFFNDKMDIESGIGKIYKTRYCEGDKTLCARYMVSLQLGKAAVPVDLYPNMFEKAKEILERAKK